MALDSYQAMWVAYYCTSETAGVERPFKPSEQLTYYRIFTEAQCFTLGRNVCYASPNSVEQKYQHYLNPQFLATLNPSWTLNQLAAVIQANSVPASQQPAGLVIGNMANAHQLFDQALSIAAAEAKSTKSKKPKVPKAYETMTKATMKKGGA